MSLCRSTECYSRPSRLSFTSYSRHVAILAPHSKHSWPRSIPGTARSSLWPRVVGIVSPHALCFHNGAARCEGSDGGVLGDQAGIAQLQAVSLDTGRKASQCVVHRPIHLFREDTAAPVECFR